MTRERDFDDILRRALRVAAESVEPAGDGLDRIRQRISSPRPVTSFLFAEPLETLRMTLIRLLVALEPVLAWARSGAARLRPLAASLRPALARLRPLVAWAGPVLAAIGWPTSQQRRQAAHRESAPPGARGRVFSSLTRWRPAAMWLRPILAVAGAVAIVVAGVFALGPLQQVITPENSFTSPGSHGGGPAFPGHTGSGSTPNVISSQPIAPSAARSSSRSARAAASCKPKPKIASTTPPATDPATPTPSDSPSVTPSPTDSTSASATPTDSAAAGSTGAHETAKLGAPEFAASCPSGAAKASSPTPSL